MASHDPYKDSRFTTPNTNLASVLGALRVPLKNVRLNGRLFADYVRVIIDAGSEKRTVLWCFEEEGEIHSAREIESFWRNRESFEAENPGHPLIPMRRALERLEWVIKVWHGNIPFSARPGKHEYCTLDINIATCLIASGYELLDVKNRVFCFGAVPSELVKEYENYRHNSHPMAQMRLALEVRKLLINELHRPDLKAEIRYTNGDPMDGGKELRIVEGTDEATINLLLEKLYED